MSETIITAAIGLFVSFLSYRQGKKKGDADADKAKNDADKTAYESYSFALNSLRSELQSVKQEYETRISMLKKDIEKLQRQQTDCENCQKKIII